MRTQIGLILRVVFGLLLLSKAVTADSSSPAAEMPDYKAFPIGIFDINTEDDLDAAKQLGCNFIETRASSVTDAFTAKAKSLNLAVVPFLLNGKMAIESLPQQLAALNLDRFQDQGTFPAIFPIDEPSGGRVPAENVVATYEALRGKLAQPQITLLNKVLETADYFQGYDILSLDPYPVFYRGDVGEGFPQFHKRWTWQKRRMGANPFGSRYRLLVNMEAGSALRGPTN